jgi:hypothetical protein
MSHENNVFIFFSNCIFVPRKMEKLRDLFVYMFFLFDWFFCIPTFYKRLTVFADFHRIFLSEKKDKFKKKKKKRSWRILLRLSKILKRISLTSSRKPLIVFPARELSRIFPKKIVEKNVTRVSLITQFEHVGW